jgi:hypothetical protein
MLHDSGAPKFLWAKVTKHAVYLKNRTWTRTLGNTTPYEILYGRKPDLSDIQPWGCKVCVHDPNNSKLEGRSKIGRWMGFDEETSDGHRIYWPEKRTITIERSVKFNFEAEEITVGELPLEGENGNSKLPISQPKDPDINSIHNTPNETPTTNPEPTEGRGQCIRKESEYVKRLRDGTGVISEKPNANTLPKGIQIGSKPIGEIPEEDLAMAAVMGGAEGIMPTVEEARKRPDWPKWDQAIKVELNNLKDTSTYQLVERPPNANIVDSRLVLHIKKNSAGEIKKYKARLVAKGFSQIYGVDYYETYAPVARLASFRLLLALAARNNWPVDTFDFDSAYLNTYLKEDEIIYLEQPKGYETKDCKSWVWKLRKTLYGLKQGARNWYEALRQALTELGFTRTKANHGVFYKEIGKDFIILAVHVDNCMVTGSSKLKIEKFKKEMNGRYKLTDLGHQNHSRSR